MLKHLSVDNDGRLFTFLLVPAGGHYRVHAESLYPEPRTAEEDVVVVYDATYAGNSRFPAPGQHVSHMPVRTLLERGAAGWWMDAGIPEWHLTGTTMGIVAAAVDASLVTS